MKIDVIELENGETMLIEVLDAELPQNIKNKIYKGSTVVDLPEGAEVIGVVDDIKLSMNLLKDDLKNISTLVKDAFKENQPNEFSVEVNFSFVGKGAIPLIVSGETKGSIKVKAIWKSGD